VGNSLAEHAGRGWRRGWAVIVSGIGGVLGLISLTVPSPKAGQPLIPAWLWATLLVGGIVVAQFLAFHDVRKERDDIKQSMQTRFDALRYRFEVKGIIGRPGVASMADGTSKHSYRFELVFSNASLEVLEYEIESVAIEVGGVTAPAEADPYPGGSILLPGSDKTLIYRDIIAPQPKFLPPDGSCDLVVNYGHPTGGQWFRMHQMFTISWEVMTSAGASTSIRAMMRTRIKPTHELAEIRS
jgi:hypothetical protein